MRDLTPRLNKSVLIEDLNKSYADYAGEDSGDLELIPRPRTAKKLRYDKYSREQQADFLDDFNTRLGKLEERLQTSINERKRRNERNKSLRSKSNWKMEFSNPNYKPKVNISIDPREEKYRPFNYKKKSLTPNIRPKSRNRRDLIKEYNESVGYDFQDDSNTESPYTSKWKKNVVPNYTPYSKAHGS